MSTSPVQDLPYEKKLLDIAVKISAVRDRITQEILRSHGFSPEDCLLGGYLEVEASVITLLRSGRPTLRQTWLEALSTVLEEARFELEKESTQC